MYLSITGDRGSGKTQLLVDHLKRFIESRPDVRVAILTPSKMHQKLIVNTIADVLDPSDLKKIFFYRAGAAFISKRFDAAYMDCANFIPEQFRTALEAATDGYIVATWETA